MWYWYIAGFAAGILFGFIVFQCGRAHERRRMRTERINEDLRKGLLM